MQKIIERIKGKFVGYVSDKKVRGIFSFNIVLISV